MIEKFSAFEGFSLRVRLGGPYDQAVHRLDRPRRVHGLVQPQLLLLRSGPRPGLGGTQFFGVDTVDTGGIVQITTFATAGGGSSSVTLNSAMHRSPLSSSASRSSRPFDPSGSSGGDPVPDGRGCDDAVFLSPGWGGLQEVYTDRWCYFLLRSLRMGLRTSMSKELAIWEISVPRSPELSPVVRECIRTF